MKTLQPLQFTGSLANKLVYLAAFLAMGPTPACTSVVQVLLLLLSICVDVAVGIAAILCHQDHLGFSVLSKPTGAVSACLGE